MNCKLQRLVRRWAAKSASLCGKARKYDASASKHPSLRDANWAVYDKINGGVSSMTAEFAKGMAHGLRMAADELKANDSNERRR